MHDHIHHHKKDRKTEKELIWSMVIIGSIFFLELFGGVFSKSLALLGDAGHMFMDFFSLFLTFFTIRLASKLPTVKKTFGLHRTEIFAALINGSVLLIVIVWMAYEAVQRIMVPEPIESGLMLVVAVIGLIANLIVAFKLHGHHDLNMKGAYLHVLGDTLSSVAVIVAAIVIRFTGWMIIDSILSLFIVVVISVGAIRLIWDAGNILLEGAPKWMKLDDVIREMNGVKKVKDVHAVHFWSVCSNVNVLTAHVLVDVKDLCDTCPIIEELNEKLEKFKVKHTTFQFETTKCKTDAKLKHLKH